MLAREAGSLQVEAFLSLLSPLCVRHTKPRASNQKSRRPRSGSCVFISHSHLHTLLHRTASDLSECEYQGGAAESVKVRGAKKKGRLHELLLHISMEKWKNACFVCTIGPLSRHQTSWMVFVPRKPHTGFEPGTFLPSPG